MNSRPLDKNKYLQDAEDISDEFLPPLMEMGTLYYYKMKKQGDNSPFLGSIKCRDIISIEIVAEQKYFTFVIDIGKKKYEFSTSTRAQCEQWVEALQLAKQTEYEKSNSLLQKNFKNISKTITDYEID